MKIKVTKEDIANGKRNDFHSCPIALATKRKLNIGDWRLSVGAVIYNRGNDKRWSLPKIARQFIINFDRGQKVKPFEFDARSIK